MNNKIVKDHIDKIEAEISNYVYKVTWTKDIEKMKENFNFEREYNQKTWKTKSIITNKKGEIKGYFIQEEPRLKSEWSYSIELNIKFMKI